MSAEGADDDGDGVEQGADCDDDDALVHPGADERCNEMDDDCDGEVDEDAVEPSACSPMPTPMDTATRRRNRVRAERRAVRHRRRLRRPGPGAGIPTRSRSATAASTTTAMGSRRRGRRGAGRPRTARPRRRRVRRRNSRRVVRARCRGNRRRDRLRRRRSARPSRRAGDLQRRGRRLRLRHHRDRDGQRGRRDLLGDPASRGRRAHGCRRRASATGPGTRTSASSKDVVLEGRAPELSIIDGNESGSAVAVTTDGIGLTLRRLTLQHGTGESVRGRGSRAVAWKPRAPER